MYPNLTGLRVCGNVSIKELADLLKLTENTVRRKIQTGMFSAEECKTLCKFFGVPFDYLFATLDDIAPDLAKRAKKNGRPKRGKKTRKAQSPAVAG